MVYTLCLQGNKFLFLSDYIYERENKLLIKNFGLYNTK